VWCLRSSYHKECHPEQSLTRFCVERSRRICGCTSGLMRAILETGHGCPEPKIRNIKLAVILSERGPKRLSVPGSPKSDLCSLGWSLGVVSRRICICPFAILYTNFRLTALACAFPQWPQEPRRACGTRLQQRRKFAKRTSLRWDRTPGCLYSVTTLCSANQ
jgi:hypothetical protein